MIDLLAREDRCHVQLYAFRGELTNYRGEGTTSAVDDRHLDVDILAKAGQDLCLAEDLVGFIREDLERDWPGRGEIEEHLRESEVVGHSGRGHKRRVGCETGDGVSTEQVGNDVEISAVGEDLDVVEVSHVPTLYDSFASPAPRQADPGPRRTVPSRPPPKQPGNPGR